MYDKAGELERMLDTFCVLDKAERGSRFVSFPLWGHKVTVRVFSAGDTGSVILVSSDKGLFEVELLRGKFCWRVVLVNRSKLNERLMDKQESLHKPLKQIVNDAILKAVRYEVE